MCSSELYCLCHINIYNCQMLVLWLSSSVALCRSKLVCAFGGQGQTHLVTPVDGCLRRSDSVQGGAGTLVSPVDGCSVIRFVTYLFPLSSC